MNITTDNISIKPLRGISLDGKATLEGGNLQVIRENIYVIGTGTRTSRQGIDFIIENIKSQKASDIISGKASVDNHKKCVITMAGSELARGGGGARCMTLPVKRKKVNW